VCPFFFVISGYCIYFAANHSTTSGGFFTKRLFRIFPPYWFSLCVTLACLLAFKLIHGSNPVHLPKTLYALLCTITLATNPISSIQGINYVYWTLTYEIFFYFLVFIGLIFPPRFRLLWFTALSALSISLAKHDHWILFFIQYWPYFCLGIILFRFLHCIKENLLQNLLLLATTVASLFFIKANIPYDITIAVTVVLITVSHFKQLKSNWLSTFGDYSYSIYLLHVPIGIYLLGNIKEIKYINSNTWLNGLLDLTMMVLIVFLAKLMYTYVELPAIQYGKKYAGMLEKWILLRKAHTN
jgi:peptidoglycan/LPS O-acetylase OafA/YrhL